MMSQSVTTFAEAVGGSDAGPVAVEGGRSRWDVGGPQAEGTRLLAAPSGVVEYTPAEMTITVGAGTPVAELNEVLAEANQRCALPDRAGTVGGAIAVGEDSLNAIGRGRVRSALLQLRYVSAEGRIISGGGPTVKNVTGFDLPRLMVGSLGTLGLIAEVTLRTNPIPPVSRWFRGRGADAFDVRDALYRPSAILCRADDVWVLLEGHAVDVDAELAVLGTIGVFDDAPPPPLPRNRWSMEPADTRSLDVEATGPYVTSILTGTVFAANPAPAPTLTAEVTTLTNRIKSLFDPTGRLNPGRRPGLGAIDDVGLGVVAAASSGES